MTQPWIPNGSVGERLNELEAENEGLRLKIRSDKEELLLLLDDLKFAADKLQPSEAIEDVLEGAIDMIDNLIKART